jgi:asparagine synthase (glutamine-hydrolysing)
MHDLLAHRGPDGEGFLAIAADYSARHAAAASSADLAAPTRLAAAFRWLKVQDVDAAAAQPMSSADGSHWILFNGAIYNHGELRSELRGHGYEFRTRSDTEVILAAYRRWGIDCLARMHGMWAMLLLDARERCLFISRDRLGIKPLFYATDGERLLLASEAKAVALARADGARVEAFRAHEFLRGMPPQSPGLTFFRDVHPVPAGTWARIDLASDGAPSPRFHAFWSLADHRAQPTPESLFEERRREFEALLRSAVRSHASAAVPVGTLLSGGLDTSTIARLLAEFAASQGGAEPRTFSIIFEDPEMSEWPYMQLVNGQGGLRATSHVLTADEAWNSADRVVRAEGQPLLGQDIIAQFHAYRLAREHGSTVVLDGQGADELLAGMPLYEAQIFPEMLRRGKWLRFACELRLRMKRYDYGLLTALGTYVRMPLWYRRMENRGLPRYGWLDFRQVDSSRFGPGRTDDWGPGESDLARFLYRHVRCTNLPQVLLLQDHSSMSHGIESRVPFLDHRLVEFVFRLPDEFKVGRGLRKRILLETVRPILPRAVVERRDKRTFVSKNSWMQLRTRRADEIREMAAGEELRGFGLIDVPRMRRFVDDFLSGRHDDQLAVWRLYTFSRWLRAFRPAL